MLAGNLLGLFETRIKRLLAYSSIAHLGYAMLALLVSGPAAVQAAAFYMTAYLVTVIAAFGVIAVLEPETGGTRRPSRPTAACSGGARCSAPS